MARLSCELDEDYSNFMDLARKKKIHVAKKKKGEKVHLYISKSKEIADYNKSHDPEMKSDSAKSVIALNFASTSFFFIPKIAP